jgi:ABC-type sugar transport system substrate-binding protein
MKKLRLLVSLVSNENDYQREQARAVTEMADRLGAETQIIYAEGDSINQSQQLLDAIQAAPESRPDAIVCHPAGTGLSQVARTAVSKGIGWAIVNRDVDYLTELRTNGKVPAFCITVDQEEVGRIQARQIAALLPQGGIVLYIQGPPGNFSAEQRTIGVERAKPANVQLRMLRGRFTEESGYHALKSWLRLSTSRQTHVDLICSQNDNMALGAKKAFAEEGSLWADLVYIGCDASGHAGQERVKRGILTASIALPTTAGLAVETFVRSYQTGTPPQELAVLKPVSFPPETQLLALVSAAKA